jgi:hypothetical protein
VFIERRSRRIELALKVLPDAIISMWRRAVKQGMVVDIPFSDVFIFSIAMSILTYYYYEKSEHMRPSMRGLYRWAFD